MDNLAGERDKWKGRAKKFQQAYRDKSHEAFALELQKTQLEAYGADVVARKQVESLRAKLMNKRKSELRAQPTDFMKVKAAVEEKIPEVVRNGLALCGWNAFGIFEIVLAELKAAKEPICCSHCLPDCATCDARKGQIGGGRHG